MTVVNNMNCTAVINCVETIVENIDSTIIEENKKCTGNRHLVHQDAWPKPVLKC